MAIQTWYADPEPNWAQQAGASEEDLHAYEAAHGSLPCPGLVGHASTVQELVRRRGEHCYTHQERDTPTRRR